MCYVYLKLTVFLKRKFQLKSVLKEIVSFIYSIDVILHPWEYICSKIINVFGLQFRLNTFTCFLHFLTNGIKILAIFVLKINN